MDIYRVYSDEAISGTEGAENHGSTETMRKKAERVPLQRACLLQVRSKDARSPFAQPKGRQVRLFSIRVLSIFRVQNCSY